MVERKKLNISLTFLENFYKNNLVIVLEFKTIFHKISKQKAEIKQITFHKIIYCSKFLKAILSKTTALKKGARRVEYIELN